MSGVGRETIARAENLVAEGRDYAAAIEALARILDRPVAFVEGALDRWVEADALPSGVERVLERCRADMAATS